MTPSQGTKELADMLDLTRDDAGFVAPDHPLLRPNNAKLAPRIPGASNLLVGCGRWGSRSEVQRRPPTHVRTASDVTGSKAFPLARWCAGG